MSRRANRDAEMDQEIAAHIEARTQANIATGMTRAQARRAAGQRFGPVEAIKEQCREQRGWWWDGVMADLRFGARALLRSPGFTLVAALTLALGIGANSAIFSVVDAILLRPLPYHAPQGIVTLLHGGTGPVAGGNLAAWRDGLRGLAVVGAAQAGCPATVLQGQGVPEDLKCLQVTADLWRVLGVQPALGRTFAREEEASTTPVVVLTHRLWQRRFGGDPRLVGKTITLGRQAHTVVGVMPPGFAFAPFWVKDAELFVPLDLAAKREDWFGQSLRAFARLAEGVTPAAAQAELDVLSRRLEREHPGSNPALDVRLVPLHERAVGGVRRALLVLLGCVGFVLVIACANVANLLLARAGARQREMAVRASLGAGRRRLLRQLLTESLLLALLGGGLGLLVAEGSVRLLRAFGPRELPRWETVSLDARVFAFAAALTLLTGLVFGLAPALQLARAPLATSLKTSATPGPERLRGGLVVGEIALALVLLVGAGLLVRSFERLRASPPGFDPHQLLSVAVSLRDHPPAVRPAVLGNLQARLRALPGVTALSAINHLPLAGDVWSHSFLLDGAPRPAPGEEPSALHRIAAPGYLATMGIRLLRGRDFNASDDRGAPGVVIVNQTLARRMWPDQDPIGQRIHLEDGGPDPRQVVGVIEDVKQREWSAAPQRELYVAYLQNPTPKAVWFVVRSVGEPAAVAAAIKRELASALPDQPPATVLAMEDVVAAALGQPRFHLLLINLLAAVALLLAAVGIYGVMAYTISQRTQEIGIRLALGARRTNIMRLLLGQGARLTAAGLALGLAVALGTTHLMQSLLYEVSATDAATFVGISLLLGTVALLACWLPARRALQVEPMRALRHE